MRSKNDKNVSVEEAARRRGCSLAAVRQLLLAGRLPSATKRNGRWSIPLSELESYYRAVDKWRSRGRSPQSVPSRAIEQALP